MKPVLPVFSRLAVARSQWQAAIVVARLTGPLNPKAMARLKTAEVEYRAAHIAAHDWLPLIHSRPPRFRRMPRIDPYAVPPMARAAVSCAA